MSQPPPPVSPAPKPGIAAKITDFVNNMDARAWRAVVVSVAMVVVVAIMLVIGRLFYGDQIAAFIDSTLGEARRENWGLLATILVFTVTAYVGAPQIVLIGACVVAFGPEQGFWFAWIATIVSGIATYFTGRLSSAETQKRFGGATGGRFTRFMGRNAFLASLIVRSLPTAPFVVVNMAFGAARVNFWAFIGGLRRQARFSGADGGCRDRDLDFGCGGGASLGASLGHQGSRRAIALLFRPGE